MNQKWLLLAFEATRFGGGLTVILRDSVSFHGVMFAEENKKVIRRALPAWVRVVDIKEFPKAPAKSEGWIVYHRCSCRTADLLPNKIRHKGTIEETAAALAKSIERAHSGCQPAGEATSTAAAASAVKRTLQECEEDLGRANKRTRVAESKQAALQRQLDTAATHQAELEKKVAVDNKATRRRAVGIDTKNWQQWPSDTTGRKGKSHAMTKEVTGVLACMRYWCKGSVGKLLQIVLALISAFQLEESVLEKLQTPATIRQRTNECIVQRLHGSLQELKEDRTEPGRLAYRTVLTAVAPVCAAKGDSSGMKSKFAKELGINRNSVPYADAIYMRQGIDAEIKRNHAPLVVGDTVCCRHGTGKLIAMPDGYPKKDGKCVVEITVGDITKNSPFDSMDDKKGGGRVRRPAISFVHAERQQRKDVTSDDVKLKVSAAQCSALLLHGTQCCCSILLSATAIWFSVLLYALACCCSVVLLYGATTCSGAAAWCSVLLLHVIAVC
jgi:hypothetical protein